MKFNNKTILFLLILVTITTLVKVICAPQIDLSGISAIMAVALFAGIKEKNIAKAILLPMLTLFISDILIQILYTLNAFRFAGFYRNQWINYLLIASLVFVGTLFRKGKLAGIIASGIVGPALFFLASNYIVWATQGQQMGYAPDFSGLMESYRLGIPFYRNSVISTLIFLPAFIALYQWIVKGKISLQTA